MPAVIATWISTATLTAGSVLTYNAILGLTYAAIFAASVAYGADRRRSAERKARDAYNNSLRDRLQMVDVTADQPRTIVLGRVRAVEGVRRRWVSGANSERLTMIVSLAGHEIDGIEAYYFDDELVTVDGSGYVTTAPYYKGSVASAEATITVSGGNGSVDVSPNVPVAASLIGIKGNAVLNEAVQVPVGIAGSVLSITGAAEDGEYVVPYQVPTGTSTARIRPYLGTAAQNVGAALAAEYPDDITATDAFAGVALLVVDIDYDPDVYVQGRPNVTALFRGAKVYDPRLDSTVPGGSGAHRLATPSTWAWSDNPALHAYHYARHANGWAVPAEEIMAPADVAAEAAACDVSTDFTLRKPDDSTATVTLPRYRSGIVVSTAGETRAAMEEILEAMAGRAGWAGGVWRFRAGRLPSGVFAMDQTWLARKLQEDGTPEPGPTLQFINGLPRESKVNRVTGVCVDPDQRYQILPFPAIEDSVLIAAEGATYPREVEYQAVNHIAHAQHLATLAIKRGQAPLQITAACNLRAYPLELFDAGTLTLPAYSISAKTMEVTGWRWHPTEGVQLTLSEISAALYTPEAELGGRDPAPNTNLPTPWQVEDLTGLAVESGTVPLSDGSLLTRTQVSWDAATTQSVRSGGRVEVQYREVGATEWGLWEEPGDATSATIPALRAGSYYVFRARFVSSPPLRVRGAWGVQAAHQIEDISLIGTDALDSEAATEVQEFYDATGVVYSNLG